MHAYDLPRAGRKRRGSLAPGPEVRCPARVRHGQAVPSTGVIFLALDDGLVPVGAGGLPVAVSGPPVGLCGITVTGGGYPVLASSVAVVPGRLPGYPGLRQHLADRLAIFAITDPVRPGLFLAGLPLPAAQLGVPQQVGYSLVAGPGLRISGVGLQVTFLRPVVTVNSDEVALSGLSIAVAGVVVPGIPGLTPARRATRPRPDAPLLPGGHPPPQQRRGLQYLAAQRVRRVTCGQFLQQPGERHGFIFVQDVSLCPRDGNVSGTVTTGCRGRRSLFPRLLHGPGSGLPPLRQPISQFLAYHHEGGAFRLELGDPPDQLVMPVVHHYLPGLPAYQGSPVAKYYGRFPPAPDTSLPGGRPRTRTRGTPAPGRQAAWRLRLQRRNRCGQ